MSQQQFDFSEKLLAFQTGNGKDAKIYIKFKKTNDDGTLSFYNVPLTTINSIQIFTNKPKTPRHAFGSADPIGLSQGVRQVKGFITSTVLNESIGNKIRVIMKNYKPLSAGELELDENGYISLSQLDDLTSLDQLPPCDINIFITNPLTGKVFSKAVYGVMFTESNYSIGGEATMGETFSFMAQETGELQNQKISQEVPSKP